MTVLRYLYGFKLFHLDCRLYYVGPYNIKKLQTIYLMLYKRQIKNCKNQKYKHERIR